MSKLNINELPYAPWLEKNLRDLVKTPVTSICISAVSKDGDVYRDYYNTTMIDKLIIAGIIQQDAMLDSMAANGIVEYVEDEEDGTDGEEKER